jgi:hypothetical protein
MVLAEAVHVEALHRDDHDFILAQLGHCVPGREDKPQSRNSKGLGSKTINRWHNLSHHDASQFNAYGP